MADSFIDQLLKALLGLFALTWGTGFALRFIFRPSKLSDLLNEADAASIPAYRQIRVVGLVRWLFGYKPVTGPVSMIGAILQLSAFLTVGMTVVLALVWPDILHTLYWLPLIILALTIALMVRFVPWLWNKQQGKK